MKHSFVKTTLALSLVAASTVSFANRYPSIAYESEVNHIKLQNPGSSGYKCLNSGCVNYKLSNVWWLHSSDTYMYVKASGGDATRSEMRNMSQFNAKTSSKSLTTYVGANILTTYLNELTVGQLHRENSSSHKPILRIDLLRTGSSSWKWSKTFAKKPTASASADYDKDDFSASTSGDKYMRIKTSGGKVYSKISSQEFNDTLGSDWPSDSKYYFKAGTYLSDVDSGKTAEGQAKFKSFNWN